MSETAKWYVIHTYSGYENKVAQDIEKVVENRKLHDMILEVRVPTEKVTEITDGKIREVERKTFPSYVLLKMIYTDDTGMLSKIFVVSPDSLALGQNQPRFRNRKYRLWALTLEQPSK